MSLLDSIAGAVFIASWLAYEPLLQRMTGGRGAINIDMIAVREGWLRRMLARENRMVDAALLGQQLNSASFFASTNLLLIAAAAGLLFGGGGALAGVRGIGVAETASDWLIEVKIALVVVTLTKGFLDFIWAIRQMNYAAALFGAAPDHDDIDHHESFVRAGALVLTPAYAAFNSGVRTYYFALAAAAWIVSPWAMIAAVIAAVLLLLRRQTGSDAALGLRDARRLFEAMQRRPD
jgi:uncharacterized membrane protein